MSDLLSSDQLAAFENATELRHANTRLLELLDSALGEDGRLQGEEAALAKIEPDIDVFLARGAATGALLEDLQERTACQILLDYWASALTHAGQPSRRVHLVPFDAAHLPDLKDKPCPYMGLEAFRDRTFFFGRETAIESLVKRVTDTPLVVVEGASGSGKSSLVMAGALPVLAAATHVPRLTVVGPFTPGNAALERLAEAVTAALPNAHLDAATLRSTPESLAGAVADAQSATLLVIDQFEETLTLSSDSDRQALARNITALLRARPDHRVVLTIREEFSSQLSELTALAPYLREHPRFSMRDWPMDYEELKAAVERPAAMVNLQFQSGIVDHMVKAVLHQDAALPLLQFALTRLWEARDRNRVTHDVYAKIGGSPLGALQTFADNFYDRLTPEMKDEVRRTLLELVCVGRLFEPYRQPMLRSALLKNGTPRTGPALDDLVQNRLVRITSTFGDRDAVVEVAHEALLRNWPRYRDWIVDKRESVRRRIALSEAAERWQRGGDAASQDLLVGWQLDEARKLQDLTALEVAYVQASVEAVDRARLERENSLRREAQRRIERRVWWGALTVAFALTVAWFIWDRSKNIDSLRQQRTLVTMARAREAATHGNLDHALAYALEGTSNYLAGGRDAAIVGAEAQATLLSVVRDATDLVRLFVVKGNSFQAIAIHPTDPAGLMAYGGSDGTIYFATPAGTFETGPVACRSAKIMALVFDPGGRWLAAGCDDGTMSIWFRASLTQWQQRGTTKRLLPRTIWSIAVSGDGRLIAAGGFGNKIKLVAVAENGDWAGEPFEPAGARPEGSIWSMAFLPTKASGGVGADATHDTLLIGDGKAQLWTCQDKGSAWACTKSERFKRDDGDAIRAIAVDRDSSEVAVGRWRGGVEIWNEARSGAPELLDLGPLRGPVHSLTFFQNCGRQYLAIGEGQTLLYHELTPGPMQNLTPVPSPCAAIPLPVASVGDEVNAVVFDARGGRLAAATAGGYVAVLDPARGVDQRRTNRRLPSVPFNQVRAAIVSAADEMTRIAVPVTPTDAERRNLLVLTVKDGRVIDAPPQSMTSGAGAITRVSASTDRLIATLRAGPRSGEPLVSVWRFNDTFSDVEPMPVLSLGAEVFAGMTPRRIEISPDGHWLAVSVVPPWRVAGMPLKPTSEIEAWCHAPEGSRLLVAEIGAATKPRWIQSHLCSGFHDMEIAFSADSKWFAAGGDAVPAGADTASGQVQFWTVGKDSSFVSAAVPDMVMSSLANTVSAITFAETPNGDTLLAAGGEYGKVDIWNVQQARMYATSRVDSRPVWHLAFNRSGMILAAADSLNVIRLWRLGRSNTEPMLLSAPSDRAGGSGFLSFGPHGAWLASSAIIAGAAAATPPGPEDITPALAVWNLDVPTLRGRIASLMPGLSENATTSARADDKGR